MSRNNLELETIKQIRFIINTYDGSNYDKIERGVKLRLEMTRGILIHEAKKERTGDSK